IRRGGFSTPDGFVRERLRMAGGGRKTDHLPPFRSTDLPAPERGGGGCRVSTGARPKNGPGTPGPPNSFRLGRGGTGAQFGGPDAYAPPVRDPVTLCAEAYAAWHSSWLTALGLRFEREGGIWRALERPPLIYLAGITLEPGVRAEAIAGVPGSVGDVWQDL